MNNKNGEIIMCVECIIFCKPEEESKNDNKKNKNKKKKNKIL